MNLNFYPISWRKFEFLLKPNEFEEIFKGFHCLDYGIGKNLPEDYIETTPQILFDNYSSFYGKLISGYKFDRMKDTYDLMWLQMGITNNLSKIVYKKNYFTDKQNNKTYSTKILDNFKEPFVELKIATLHFDGNNQPLLEEACISLPEKVISMVLKYPKEINYYEEEEEYEEITFEKTVNCDEMETYNHVYKRIVENINNISKNLTISKNGKNYETSIKISKSIHGERGE